MDRVSRQILSRLATEHELTIHEITEMLPKKSNNHADFCLLAKLIKDRYIDVPFKSKEKAYTDNSVNSIAIDMFVWANKDKEDFDSLGITSTGADFRENYLYSTTKAELLLNKLDMQNKARKWAVGVGVVTAIVASVLTD